MTIQNLSKLVVAPFLGVVLASCGSSDSGSDEPGADLSMGQGQIYLVEAYDRLVNTSPDPARVRVALELDEAAGTTQAEVTLLEGSADLFR